MNNKIYLEIVEIIKNNFPKLNVSLVRDSDDVCYFIEVDDKEVYETIEFQELVMGITINLLWKENIYNVYFCCH